MRIIIDNTDPNRRPDAPAPADFNKSVPHRSPDTIRYSGSVVSGKPYVYTNLGPKAVAVTFHQTARDRTWVNVVQFLTTSHSGGSYGQQVSEGVSTTSAILQRWEATLGAEVTVDLEVFSAALSASLSQGGENSVSVELTQVVTTTHSFDFKEGVKAEVAGWQLEETYVEQGWVYVWTNTANGKPGDVTADMIEGERQAIEKALTNKEKPFGTVAYQLPTIVSGSSQFWTTFYPPEAAVAASSS